MEELVSIIGKPLTSTEVQRTLSRFTLTDEVLDPLEEGMPAERFLTDKAGGIQVEVRPDGRIGTLFLYSFGKDGFGQFQRPLMSGLSFSSKPADVLECLGNPSASAVLDPPVFGVSSWTRYDTPSHATHFSFGVGGITLVTVMPIEWRPGGYSGG